MQNLFLNRLCLTLVAMLFAFVSGAQNRLSISGTVVNEKGEHLKSATVFLSGTKYITGTNSNGGFAFRGLEPGAYQVVIKMLGYAAETRNITLQTNGSDLKVNLQPKHIELREIIVGGDPKLHEKYELFKENFLGSSTNALDCKILNPEVLILKEDKIKNTLEATSDDFLIIENRQLGYKIKYLLKNFVYLKEKKITTYSGDTSFEEMPGTANTIQKWKKNREEVYRGSLMHFFRAVYKGMDQPLKEGFITQSIISQDVKFVVNSRMVGAQTTALVDPRITSFDTLVNLVDTAFISLKFKRGLAVVYNPKKALTKARGAAAIQSDRTESVILNKNISTLQLGQNEALIDSRGNITNYPAALIKGYWGDMRIGDQLPFEYQP